MPPLWTGGGARRPDNWTSPRSQMQRQTMRECKVPLPARPARICRELRQPTPTAEMRTLPPPDIASAPGTSGDRQRRAPCSSGARGGAPRPGCIFCS